MAESLGHFDTNGILILPAPATTWYLIRNPAQQTHSSEPCILLDPSVTVQYQVSCIGVWDVSTTSEYYLPFRRS